MVAGVLDTTACFFDTGHQRSQGPGKVAELDRDAAAAPAAHEAATDDPRQHRHVDVAAADDKPHLFAVKAVPVLQQRGQAGGTGALCHRFFYFQQEQDRLLDALLCHQEDFID